jgi:serine/threonine-protein kinase
MEKPNLYSSFVQDRPTALSGLDDNARTLASPMRGMAMHAAEVAAAPHEPTQVSTADQMKALTATQQGRRATVLPRVTAKNKAVALTPSNEDRYQLMRTLGAGAMGEVSLEKDNDIGRTVAVKRLTGDANNPDGLVRFISEVRTIGQLEHPNIIPIHDVGLDENGRYYFVMKYVDGETLEAIINKLAAGDPDYHARYPVEVRLEIFLGLLHALQYAHDQGVLHRDIKPANVMVGRYGEVILMDWGIAKQIRREPLFPEAPKTPSASSAGATEPLFTTRNDQFIGTPAYMAPEQAKGMNDKIDERTDLYSATVLLHELLALRHYLAEYKTLNGLLVAIISMPITYSKLLFMRHPNLPVPRAELLHYVVRGLAKDPDQRFGSAMEMIGELQRVIDGRCRLSCPATTAKRLLGETGRFVDRHPLASPFIFYAAMLWIICSFCFTAYAFIR